MAVAVSLDVGLGRILGALVAGVMAMAMAMASTSASVESPVASSAFQRWRCASTSGSSSGVVVLALIRSVAMAMSFDVVLGRVLVLRLAMVLVLRHSGSSCLWANTKN